MALAETARLIASLELQDKLSPGVSSATAGVAKLEGGVSRLSGLGTKLGGAFQFAGNRLKGLATAGLGILGIAGGLSIVGAFKSGIQAAQDFGAEVVRLSKLTGLSVETTSALASAFHHYNVDAETAAKLTGFLEKSVGTLAQNRKKLIAFEEHYGIALRNSNGHLKDANELLLSAADFFNNKHIPAQNKAVVLTKLFGKSWQDLIPFLSAGRQGIKDAEEEARRLGLTLTKDNIAQLAKSKEATRDWSTALAGLKLQLGLNLLPVLTKFTVTATEFVVKHRGDILSFFSKAADFVGTLADALSRIPSGLGITDIIKGAIRAWDDMPDGLRDLLVKGFVADRSIKFLFGISPAGAVGNAIGSAIGKGLGGLAGSIFQRGGTPATPLFVADVARGLGGIGGAIGTAGAAAGGLGIATIATLAAGVLAFLGVGYLLLQTRTPEVIAHDKAMFAADNANRGFAAGAPGGLSKLEAAQWKTNQILGTIAYREQRLGEITGGKSDIIAAATNKAIDAVERARQSLVDKQTVTNNRLDQVDRHLDRPITLNTVFPLRVVVNTGFSTYEYAQTLNRQTTSRT